MLIAKEKAKSNIGEYLIYMFQIEDLIRACKFDTEVIEKQIVNQYNTDKETKKEIYNWYIGLCEMMTEEGLKESGHLSFIENKINELFDFHLYLKNKSDQHDYIALASGHEALIAEAKTKQRGSVNDIKAILNLVYGVYLLRLKQSEISKETLKSVQNLSGLLELLSAKYKDYETGKLKIE